ncbi:CD151 antigen-like [Haliotis asinina]|uniref:CD151 antigen-like n=1 Tax=Haliotis asinina TaxID=109174 RepID=UPI00353184FB
MAPRNRRADNGCCSLLFLRYVLFVFNVLFWATGLAFLIMGIWTIVNKHRYVSLLGNNTYPATTFLFLAIGTIIIFVGILGCLGTVKDNRCCLVSYAFLLLVIFLLEAVAGVLAYMYEGAIREELTRNLNHTIINNYNFYNSITDAVNDMQKEFKCCGAGSYKDWHYSRWLKMDTATENVVPDSCCISPMLRCGKSDSPSNIYWKGCSPRLEESVKKHLILIGGIGLGLCCVQIFGIIFACCLARKIKESKEGY